MLYRPKDVAKRRHRAKVKGQYLARRKRKWLEIELEQRHERSSWSEMTKKLEDLTVDDVAALISKAVELESDYKMVADKLTQAAAANGMTKEECAAAAQQLSQTIAQSEAALAAYKEDPAVARAKNMDTMSSRPASWPAGQQSPSPQIKPGAHEEGGSAGKPSQAKK